MSKKLKKYVAIITKDEQNIYVNDINIIKLAENGDLDGIVDALKSGIDVNYTESRTGITAIHAAAARGRYEVVKLLLSCNGIDPNPLDKFNRTPYTIAVNAGHREIASDIHDFIVKSALNNRPTPDIP